VKVILTCIIKLFLLGTIYSSQATAQPLPDLIINPETFNPFIVTENFSPDHCAVDEGCVQSGNRILLRFATETRNVGDADLILGSPIDNELFHFHACHGHYHMENYVDYQLLDEQGFVICGFKSSFCLLDSYRFDPGASSTRVYNCLNQGLQTGWADLYSANLDCQWLDITDVAEGNYFLEIEVNPERIIEESDYTNNLLSVPVIIPPTCGNVNHPYPSGDYTLDCNVNWIDMAFLSEEWMTQYQIADLMLIVNSWLQCTHPSGCL